ncbi:two-component system sensor histidine kinase NtrB [Pseudoxanthomonas dokdonensis]|uniref:histidine kinase n=1 Tax=Pseudoxanthomonas dokdonensis TaxID=344882 RepID=A0A0R0CVK8_9GAMM|nr:PAS domain-containing sensor histidine kinase [Pseudoxanthomonas dokdonensis]KRG70410.1 transcriptional regulator [Pseudoxanthomonas dokdonensis]
MGGALRQSELEDESRQLALLVQSVTDYAIYMLDVNGYVRSWNAGGQRIKGYTDSEIVGQHFSRFYTPEDAAAELPAHGLRQARIHGRYEAEGWRLRKDGSRFWASVVIDSIIYNGELIGFAKITRDITERYHAQIELQEAQHALAHSQKIEAIGKLTLGLAHDFNNLLGIIINSLDLINLQPSANQRTRELTEAALRAADRGALLTRQLLGFGRGTPLAAERCDVNELLARSFELYRRAGGQQIELQLEAGRDVEDVELDAAQFEAAILNLISNGRDAMLQGGRMTLRTSLKCKRPPDDPAATARDYVCIEVIDNGLGMDASTMARAEEPFFTTKEVGKGSGLGLSQVAGFAGQSGGFLAISSQVGQGTTVAMYLPVMKGEAGG